LARWEVIDCLKRSLKQRKTAHAGVKPEDLQWKVNICTWKARQAGPICALAFTPMSTWAS
jgi:hypothetical protein